MQDLYETIDMIQEGDAPWKTIRFKYNSPKPPTPPKWMEETYELCLHDILVLTEQQLGNTDFKGNFILHLISSSIANRIGCSPT